MDVQNIFYTMGILYMTISFIFMVALIALLLFIKNKVNQLQKNIQEKIEIASTVSQAGGKAVEIAVDKIREFIDIKNKNKQRNSKEK